MEQGDLIMEEEVGFEDLFQVISTGEYGFSLFFEGREYKFRFKDFEDLKKVETVSQVIELLSGSLVEIDGKSLSVEEAKDHIIGIESLLFPQFLRKFFLRFSEYIRNISDKELFEDFIKRSRGLWKLYKFAYRGVQGSFVNDVLKDFSNRILFNWIIRNLEEDEKEEYRKLFLHARLATSEGIAIEKSTAIDIVTERYQEKMEAKKTKEFKELYRDRLKQAVLRKRKEELERQQEDIEDEEEEVIDLEKIREENRLEWEKFIKEAEEARKKYIESHTKESI